MPGKADISALRIGFAHGWKYTIRPVYFGHTRICIYRIVEFVTLYKAVEKRKADAVVKRVLYPMGVRNVVATIEREVVLASGTLCFVSDI